MRKETMNLEKFLTEYEKKDIVRHPLVQRIVDAYEKRAEEEKSAREEADARED